MPWRRRTLALAVTTGFVGLAGAGSALAAPPVPPVTPPATTPTTAAPPAAGSATLYLPDVFFVRHSAVTVPRRSFHLVGIVRPYVAGEAVTVEARLGRRVIKTQTVVPAPSANHSYGHFRVHLASPASGKLTIVVTHTASPQVAAFQARRSLAVLNEHVGFGSTGRFVQLIQQRLAALHFYIPQTGVYDEGTGLAVDAYHRLLRQGTSQQLDGRMISFLLDGLGSFRVRFAGHGRHAEGNLSLQLLALVNGSKVDAIYPISSGKPSTPTILGDFHVYSKVPGYLPDGMYYSNFFIRGYAIHGYDPAPDYPASHGCMRLPITDAISVYDWIDIGDWVDVYY
ncbi:MAG TPA: L,D-transpeptidase [Solirubrobacteraceae bacterium]|nr:L,D-transpeptidase [Solirubrobacteraceae bacterium]